MRRYCTALQLMQKAVRRASTRFTLFLRVKLLTGKLPIVFTLVSSGGKRTTLYTLRNHALCFCLMLFLALHISSTRTTQFTFLPRIHSVAMLQHKQSTRSDRSSITKSSPFSSFPNLKCEIIHRSVSVLTIVILYTKIVRDCSCHDRTLTMHGESTLDTVMYTIKIYHKCDHFCLTRPSDESSRGLELGLRRGSKKSERWLTTTGCSRGGTTLNSIQRLLS